MNDIWNFIQGLGDDLQDIMAATNLIPVILFAVLIGMFTANSRHALKALIAVVLVFVVRMIPSAINGHLSLPGLPDYRHLAPIVGLLLMYVLAYGLIAAIGNLKTAMKLGGAKAAH